MQINYDKIAKLADENGLSLSGLSVKINRERTFLYKAKETNRVLKYFDIKRIANVLGTSAAFLTDETDDPTPDEAEIGVLDLSEADVNRMSQNADVIFDVAKTIATRPQTQVLFSAVKNASDEDIQKVIDILKVLRGNRNNG